MARAERTSEPAWSAPLAVRDVPATGRHLELVADERTRAAVAKLAGLSAVPHLGAQFDVAPHGNGGLHVTGRVSATVGQTCVVTLEPVENEVDEPIDLIFAPPDSPLLVGQGGAELDVSSEDGPEVLVGGAVDLGAIATEFLILGLDPYPRRPDAVFQAPAEGEDSARAFAALASLKKA